MNIIFRAQVALSAAAVLCSCAGTEPALPVSGNSVAYFDNFTYKGADTFYAQNPLPADGSFYNPILQGWYSDPSICTNGEGDYFLVTSTFVYFPGVPIFHSRDLITWKPIGYVLNRESQLFNMKGQHVSGGIFAPAISYNAANKTYYMITTNVGGGNFFVKTQDPFGEWSEPIMLPEVGGIDPSFFFDDNGKAYIVNNDEPSYPAEYPGHRAIRVREFDVNTDRTVGDWKILVDKGVNPAEKPIWIEGPHMYKINGKYFLMDAEGGTSHWHSEVIFRSDSPWGPFEPWDKNPILTQRHLPADRPNPVTCAGHADLVQTPEGDWWAVFLACRPVTDGNGYENLGRETFIVPVKWSDDGFPYMLTTDETVPMIVRREGFAPTEETRQGNFSYTNTFDADKLDYEWLTLRSAAEGQYSLTETPGYMALHCSSQHATGRETPSLLCYRMQHHLFECSARMVFDAASATEAAGMALFKDEKHHYFFAVGGVGAQRNISLYRIDANGQQERMATELIGNGAVDMRIVSSGTAYDFYYNVNGAAEKLLIADVDARYLSTANAGGFTGSVIGLYAIK